MIAGIVCEYNPFHNGHLHHINETRKKADYIVCVMSGNFVQRGECAYIDKWTRARLAVMQGADIVIDLPTPWSCAGAGSFARGSIALLQSFGIDMLSFGSETESLELLQKCADISTDPLLTEKAKQLMSQGLTYPAAISASAKDIYGEEFSDVLSGANNTLAIEYIKAANELSCSFSFLPVKRQGAMHDSSKAQGNIASASKIRGMENFDDIQKFVSPVTFEWLSDLKEVGVVPCSLSNCEKAILSSLREIRKDDYPIYISDRQGLSSRIYESVRTAESLQMLYENAKSKNYTLSRIRRDILSLYLKIPAVLSEGIPPYIRILAVNFKGLTLLKSAKENSRLPIVTKHSDMQYLNKKGREIYEIQCSSTDKFAICSEKIRPCGLEQRNSMIIVK